MNKLLALFLLLAAALTAGAQSISPPGETVQGDPAPPPDNFAPKPTPAPVASSTAHGSGRVPVVTQEAMDQLTRSNQELLDLLKKQQAVLEDIQYDRRLQNRQITLLEQRLEETLQLNASLETKVARLEATAAANAANAGHDSGSNADDHSKPADTASVPAVPQPPPPPASHLPPEEMDGGGQGMWWHRLVSLSGADSKTSDTFHIAGKQWRVLWHNQDRPGESYKNTSALFISAFPKNDTLPKKVCSQLGSGGEATVMNGSGDYYLKIEASGGAWELAVEDFR